MKLKKATSFDERMKQLGKDISLREALRRKEKIPKEPLVNDFDETGGNDHG
jgi:hypothetical protein